MNVAPILILGCGRSGTSIFGELFADLPGFAYHSEPEWSEVLRLDMSRRHAIKVPREPVHGRTDPGLSFVMEEFAARFGQPQVFWIVRHPYDAVASLRVGIAQDWGHHPRPPDWKDWLNRPLVERCAHHWNYLNTHAPASLGTRAHIVRFEDLVTDPERFAASILSYVGATDQRDSDAGMRWASRVQNENNEEFVEALTSREYSRDDHTVRVGRWKENLSASELLLIPPIVGRTATALGYELPDV